MPLSGHTCDSVSLFPHLGVPPCPSVPHSHSSFSLSLSVSLFLRVPASDCLSPSVPLSLCVSVLGPSPLSQSPSVFLWLSLTAPCPSLQPSRCVSYLGLCGLLCLNSEGLNYEDLGGAEAVMVRRLADMVPHSFRAQKNAPIFANQLTVGGWVCPCPRRVSNSAAWLCDCSSTRSRRARPVLVIPPPVRTKRGL